jgi:hypothetical protein
MLRLEIHSAIDALLGMSAGDIARIDTFVLLTLCPSWKAAMLYDSNFSH